jgi:alkanesulfonate monooxygenase SsuD/methylene tetrahydromethanopterin reductase-like flavin-dependent oxidoreductase (luciferase family)
MDVGVGLPTTIPETDGRALIEFARHAEHRGFSTLSVFDRMVFDNYDCVVALAAAAAVTRRVRLATTVLLAAYRPSVAELAKQLASVDRISGGRLVVGVAAGGREDDFRATGASYHDRGRRLDRMIEELRQVWAGDGPVPGIGPRPSNSDIPLWIGGHSEAALRRAARHGTAWIAPGGSASGYPALVQRARQAFTAAGRADPPRIIAIANVALGQDRRERAADHLLKYYSHVGPKAKLLADNVIADAGQLAATVTAYAAAGCDELLLFPATNDVEQLDEIASAVLDSEGSAVRLTA